VQTELHDVTMGAEAGGKFGMPLDAFTNQAFDGIASGKDEVYVGTLLNSDKFLDLVDMRRTMVEGLAAVMQGGH
jgi:hypothetical protein